MYTTFFNAASIVKVDERLEGEIEMPTKINNYTIKTIERRAFSSNEKITSVKLPGRLEIIKEDAFSFCDLESVIIPLSVKTIENDAFSDASKLTDIYYEGTKEDWDKIEIQDENIGNLRVHFSE